MRIELAKQNQQRLDPDVIGDGKLSTIVGEIKNLVKKYQSSIQTQVNEVNGSPTEIAIVIKIKL